MTSQAKLSGTSGQGCCTVDTHHEISPPVNMVVIIEQCKFDNLARLQACNQHMYQLKSAELESTNLQFWYQALSEEGGIIHKR